MKFLLLGLLFLSPSSQAGTAETPNAIWQDYLQLQTELAHDSFQNVKSDALKLSDDAKSKKQIALSDSAQKLSLSTDLAQARLEFEKTSTLALRYFKKQNLKEVQTIYCPMKKIRWAQKKGPIENPFYGKQMLECGVKD